MKQLISFWIDKKRLAIIGGDILLIVFSYYFSFLIRFEMEIPSQYFSTLMITLPLSMANRLFSFWYFGLYRGVWRFASSSDLISIFKAVSVSSILIILALFLVNQFSGYPRSIFLLTGCFFFY